MNLTLIGMSGAGKSYVGKRLAEKLHLRYIDIDAELECEYGKILPEIIDDLGEDGFVKAEGDATIKHTEGRDDLLISTGGSVIYSPEAMEHLDHISSIVYLRVPFETIFERVDGNTDRMGRIIGLRSRSLRELYDEREPLYDRYAHATFDPSPVDEMIASIVDTVQN